MDTVATIIPTSLGTIKGLNIQKLVETVVWCGGVVWCDLII